MEIPNTLRIVYNTCSKREEIERIYFILSITVDLLSWRKWACSQVLVHAYFVEKDRVSLTIGL